MKTIDCIPNEVLVKIFTYLDGLSLNNSIQTCKKWKKLGNKPSVWEQICQNFWSLNGQIQMSRLKLSNGRRQDIRDSGGCKEDIVHYRHFDNEIDTNENDKSASNEQILHKELHFKKMKHVMRKYLPKDYEIKHFIRASESNLKDWKFVYKFLTTCLIVNQNIEDLDKANEEMYNYGSPHKQLRKKRIFNNLQNAIDECEENGIIYIHSGSYTEDITIDKNVHIYGSLHVSDKIYLNARFLKKITWKSSNGSLTCINFITNLDECDRSLEIHGSVTVRCCLFKNINHCGVYIQKDGKAIIEECRFSGCKEPFNMDEEFELLYITSSSIKDVVCNDLLKKIINNIIESSETEEKESRLISYIRLLTLLSKSEINRANVSGMILKSINHIIEKMDYFKSYKEIQCSFCELFEELLKDERIRISSIYHNLLSVSVLVLKIYKNDPIMIQFTCSIIGRLSSHQEVLPFIEKEKLYELLMNMCFEYRADALVIKEVLGCLWNVVWLSDKAKIYLFENNFIPFILSIIETKKNMNNPFIQISACGVIWNMSSKEEISKDIIKRGGLKRLLETLIFYQNDGRLLTIVDERIHWVILSMMSNFSDVEEGREIIMKMDGINLAIEAMKRHPKSVRMEKAIIAFFKKVYVNDKYFKEFLEENDENKITIDIIKEYYHFKERRRLAKDMKSMVI